MRLNKIFLPFILAFSVVLPSIADNPCSSIATTEPSQQNRKFENKELSFEVPGNFRIMNTQLGFMIHSPWSYEVHTCQLSSKYPSGYIEKGVLIKIMSYEKASEFIQDIDLYSDTIATIYPGTTAKMYVTEGSEAAAGFVFFVKNNKMVVIEIPMFSNVDGTPSTEVHQMYKPTVDLVISTIQVK